MKDTYFKSTRITWICTDTTTLRRGGGHGLFSNAKSSDHHATLFTKGSHNGVIFSSETFERFNHWYYCALENRRGVGLDKPQLWGGGMAFEGISKESFGHSGLQEPILRLIQHWNIICFLVLIEPILLWRIDC